MKITSFPDFSKARVAVIGDLMVDQYVSGNCTRISPEAPVAVLKVDKQSYHPGGAGNVAINLAALGASVKLLGIYGADKNGQIMADTIQASNIQLVSPPTADISTIVKQRMIAHNQQMLRVDFEQSLPDRTTELLSLMEEIIHDTDVLILSDYGKGTLLHPQPFIELACENDVVVLVDPKGNDFTRYKGASYITPNWNEFEQVVGKCNTEQHAADAAFQLISQCQLDGLLVTRGENGMSLYKDNGIEQHTPTLAKEVFDVTGAGDTVIATLAASLGCNLDIGEAIVLANHAAGIVVGMAGVASVSAEELHGQVYDNSHVDAGIVSEDQLLTLIENSRKQKEKIVLTNGCFDILHAGHVTYLKEAKRLGDRLVVLINSSESVKRLKGKGRPVNELKRRMQVIAGLSSVDWVCSFDEDTPLRLIELLQPDILVKGGDYQNINDIVGADEVMQYGGEVKLLSLVDGLSTSNIIKAAGSRSSEEIKNAG